MNFTIFANSSVQSDQIYSLKVRDDDSKPRDSEFTEKECADGSLYACSVTISREGLEKLEKNKNASSLDVDTDEMRQIGWDLSKTTNEYAVENEWRVKWKSINKDGDEVDKNLLQAYTEKYNEIKTGYADGTREVYVPDENGGYRLATEEEEIAMLDKGFENCVESYEDSWDAKELNMKLQLLGERYHEEQQYEWDKRHGLKAERRSAEDWERYATLKQEEFAKYKKENYIENFAERVNQMQSFVKSMYSQYSNDLTGLVGVAYQSLEIENRDELQ